MSEHLVQKSIMWGSFASGLLLAVYFIILTLVSGWSYAQNQFLEFWYFVLSLTLGFGVQIGLYYYVRTRVKEQRGGGKIIGVTGTTSTVAMISCCTHYLANILPILGTVGIVTLVAQYQIELFWVGILFNIAGIIYMVTKVPKIAHL